MGDLRYCPQCGKNQYTKADINWIIFIVLLILGVILGLVYLVYCTVAKSPKCEVCGNTILEPPKMGERPM